MSEWGIEQNSTFGNCGGCFVQGISLMGGIGIIILLTCLTCSGTTKKQSAVQHNEPKIEKTHVTNNNTKYNDSTLFVKSVALNQKTK